MKSTTQLTDEHKGIIWMLEILGKVCDRLEKGEKIPVEHLESILEFLQIFADKCHHGKEEGLLFPLLEEKGVPKEQGPIAVMLAEHDEGRSYIKGMKEGIEDYKENGKSEKIIQNGRGYIELLTNHIGKENTVLFPMADGMLSNEEDSGLLSEFENLETEKIGAGKHEEFHKLLGKLNEIYLNE